MPLNMNGSEGKQHQWNKQFVHNLRKKITIPFFFQDERLSTQAAYRPLIETGISYQKREEAVDKVAACYILQTALDRRVHFLQKREREERNS
jgi:putative Holliday junction resolvase